MSTTNAKLYTIEECMQVTVMVSDLHTMLDDQLVVAGAVSIVKTLKYDSLVKHLFVVVAQIAIIDIGNLTLDHILQLTPNVVKQLTILSQEASPLRLKVMGWIQHFGTTKSGPICFFFQEQHFIRCPAGFELGFNSIFKRLLTPKNQSRVITFKRNIPYRNLFKSDSLFADDYS
jgi:hypothetical protein